MPVSSMGKRTEKSVKGGAPSSATSRGGDESSTPEPYSCTGNFADDFVEIWQRSGLNKKHVPVVRPRAKCPATPTAEEVKASPDEEESVKTDEEQIPSTYTLIDNVEFVRPSMQVEFEIEDTRQMQINHAKELFIRGWKVEEKVVGVLKLCSLERLHCINLWNVGLTENALKLLANFIPNLPNVKTMVLDGNPIPDSEPYYLLIADESPLQHLSLRNNQITDKGAEKIGKCLQNNQTQARFLTTLNLSFNQISDKGATELAQGLRMNRMLLSLSLASNEISDEGCKALARVLQRFPLTHEEVVQRRKLLSQQGYYGRESSAPGSRRADSKDRPSSNRSGSQMATRGNRGSSKKKPDTRKSDIAEKTPKKEDRGKKDIMKMSSRISMTSETPKGAKGKKSGGGGKDGAKRNTTLSTSLDADMADLPEFVHPLLDPHAEHTEGKVFVSGCMTLVNLNLSRNKIGHLGMESMLTAVQYQVSRHRMMTSNSSAPGLLKLSLYKNSVPTDHATFIKIQEIMTTRDPSYKPDVKSPDEDIQSVMS